MDIETKGAQYALWPETRDGYNAGNHLIIDKNHGLSASYVRIEAGRKPLLFYEEYLDDEIKDDEG